MNRFKFRIWDIENKCWMRQVINSESNVPEWRTIAKNNDQQYPVSLDWIILHPKFWVVQQFIGLVDENNKEIYEGDIIKGYSIIDNIGSGGYVNSDEYEFKGKVEFNGCGFYCGNADFPIDQYQSLEILGNIFENPELLKDKECCRNNCGCH